MSASAASVALVTGATGLVGSHIVDRLLSDGWRVRALTRRAEHAALLPEPVEIIAGDVLDEASVVRAAEGAHVIFHCAANISVPGWEDYRATNVDGTRNVLSAAERWRCRVLQVSSVAVYGASARYDAAGHGERTDERTPLPDFSCGSYYARSKRESEALALRAHSEGRVWTTVVRPCVVYGRRDRQFVPRMARIIERGAIPLLRGGRAIMAVVHAENVAAGAVLAATSDIAGGKAYNLTNDFEVTVRGFFELAGAGLGRKPLWIPMPVALARGTLAAARLLARFGPGRRLGVAARSAVDFISRDNPFSSDRARRELGWAPAVRPETGVPDAFMWWKNQKKKGAA